MMRTIVVVDYDPSWPEVFERLRARVWPAVRDVAVAIEHVGSTSVPGLAAKPIVDMTVVVAAAADVRAGIDRLATLGYGHRGDLGVEGREAFDAVEVGAAHHLYLCPRDSLALLNHLSVRDHLRRHPDSARAYGALKKTLAARFPHDVDAYVEGKTDFLLGILREAGLSTDALARIERANRIK